MGKHDMHAYLAFGIPIAVAYLVGKTSTACEKCMSVELGVLGAVVHRLARLTATPAPASPFSEYGPLCAALFVAFAGPTWGMDVSSTIMLVAALVAVETRAGDGKDVWLTLAGGLWGAAYGKDAEAALLLVPALAVASGAVGGDAKTVGKRALLGAAPAVLVKAGLSTAALDGALAFAKVSAPSAASASAALAAAVAAFGGPVGAALAAAGFAAALKLLSPASRAAKVLMLAAGAPLAYALVGPSPESAAGVVVPVGVAAAVVLTEVLARAAKKSDLVLVVALTAVLLVPVLTAQTTVVGCAAAPAAPASAFSAPAAPPMPPKPKVVHRTIIEDAEMKPKKPEMPRAPQPPRADAPPQPRATMN